MPYLNFKNVLLTILLIAAAKANVYYVNSAASSASWNQARSRNTPCSPVMAMDSAKAGDTVYFRGGTYGAPGKTVSFSPKHSGTQAAPIFFSSCPGDTNPLIIGTLAIKGKSWISCSSFSFQGNEPPPKGWKDMPAVIVNDSSVTIPAGQRDSLGMKKVYKKYSTYMAWNDSMADNGSTGILISQSSHITVSNNVCFYCAYGILFTRNTSSIIAENNKVHHCYVGISGNGDTSVVNLTDGIIRNNHCYQNMNEGICIASNCKRVLIENNLCEYSAISHIDSYLYTTNVTIRGDTVRYGGYYAETMPWPGPSGIDVGLGVTGLVIENNYVAYQMDVTGGDGMGIIIDRNDERGGTADTIRNNIVYRNQGCGIALTKSSNNVVVNNTCVENGFHAAGQYNGFGVIISALISSNTVVANNIFFDNSKGGIIASLANQAYIDYNLYYSSSATGMAIDAANNRSYATLKDLSAGTSREKHGIEADPHFTNSTDYHLVSPSPAINAGTKAYSALTDCKGASRDSLPDIGAYEYSRATGIIFSQNSNSSGHSIVPAPIHPNPIVSSTNIKYSVAAPGQYSLKILDSRGREITALLNTIQLTGQHTVLWNDADAAGRKVENGVYFCQLKGDNGQIHVQRMVYQR